jgi:hypothetical protein
MTTPTTPTGGSLLRYALAAAARGWAVFPVTPSGKTPAIPGAHPAGDPARGTCRGTCGRPGHGAHDATTDPAVLRAWWAHCPTANIGIATGPSNLLVIDLDLPKPGHTPPAGWDLPGVLDGRDAFALVCERAGRYMPLDTFTVTTRRGGLHLYYAAPAGLTLGNTSGAAGRGLGWCIDTRGAGGYVVGPGSHVDLPDGTGTYDVLHAGAAAPLPAWIADLLSADPNATATPTAAPQAVAVPAGYVGAALRGEVQRVLDARPGTRNHTLNCAAYNLGRHVTTGLLDAELARDTLVQAALAVGLTDPEAHATITSGLGARTRRGGAA